MLALTLDQDRIEAHSSLNSSPVSSALGDDALAGSAEFACGLDALAGIGDDAWRVLRSWRISP